MKIVKKRFQKSLEQLSSNKFPLIVVFSLFALVVFAGCNPFDPMDVLRWDHIQSNVPAQANFNKFMTRDLESYFEEVYGKKVTVEWELLRDQPTQVGVAFPKYYLWVRVYEGKNLLDAGALRVAAENQEKFDVIQAFNAIEIDDDVNAVKTLQEIFPADLVPVIIEKAKKVVKEEY